MIRYARDLRLIPIVLLAVVCLFALKVSGLVFDGGYTLGERLAAGNRNELTIADPASVPATPTIVGADGQLLQRRSWAQEMFNYPSDVTGSVSAAKPATPATPAAAGAAPTPAPAAAKKPEEPPKDPGGTVISVDPPRIATAGERAVLERLQDRRQEIEGRGRELEMRENLLKQAEGRLEAKLMEMKALDAKLNGTGAERGKAEAQRFKNLVSMYENMKPKDAARIFDRLDLKILVDVTTQINPRKMSDILGQMSSEAAERLTVELAKRAMAEQPATATALPKIEGYGPSETAPKVPQKGS